MHSCECLLVNFHKLMEINILITMNFCSQETAKFNYWLWLSVAN